MPEVISKKLQWFFDHRTLLIKRAFIIEIFTETNYVEIKRLSSITDINQIIKFDPYEYDDVLRPIMNNTQLCSDGKFIYGVDYEELKGYTLTSLGKIGSPIFGIYEEFNINKSRIENFTKNISESTTFGRYILNYITLAVPFKDKVPYVNEEWKIKDVEKIIANKIITGEITSIEYDQYMNNMFYIGTFSELIVPVFSEKSLTTDPKIKKRKKELLTQYKDELHIPLVCAKIEDELINMDKDYLKGDPSMGFYGSDAKKFNVHRKKQHITIGLTEAFSKDKSEYAFIPEALSEGWDVESFPAICDEIRRGSYNRGIDTAKGGEQSKFLLRVFQNTIIIEEDCGTRRGLSVIIDKDMNSQFYGRYAIVGTKLIPISKDNIDQFMNKEIKIRSLMYCETKQGFCYKCAGDMFRALDIRAIGVMALEIGSAFLSLSMKSMHGVKMAGLEINDISEFIV